MTLVVVSYTLLILGAIAAAGVASPLLRRRRLPEIELGGDPFEERRRVLLVTLKDIDTALQEGALDADAHAQLRSETEASLARLLRILDERAKDGHLIGSPQRPTGTIKTVPRWSAIAIVAAAIGLALFATLRSSLGERSQSLAFTGSGSTREQPASAEPDPLAYFESRVAADPRDTVARLDLADRYLDAGRVEDAIEQYLLVLEMEGSNVEARARLGFVLYRADRPRRGLRLVNQALQRDPQYPEALFFKGVILATSLERPRQAAEALRAYLQAAPFGAERQQARRLLRKLTADKL